MILDSGGFQFWELHLVLPSVKKDEVGDEFPGWIWVVKHPECNTSRIVGAFRLGECGVHSDNDGFT